MKKKKKGKCREGKTQREITHKDIEILKERERKRKREKERGACYS